MTKKETMQVLAVLKAAYPASYKGLSKEEATGTVTVWWTQFASVPTDIVLIALQKCISVCKFPPTVCEVREAIGELREEASFWLRSAAAELMASNIRESYRRISEVSVLPEVSLSGLLQNEARLIGQANE